MVGPADGVLENNFPSRDILEGIRMYLNGEDVFLSFGFCRLSGVERDEFSRRHDDIAASEWPLSRRKR